MKTTHKGLGITEADWAASVVDLNATLDKFKVPKAERDEVVAAISGLKKDIVEKYRALPYQDKTNARGRGLIADPSPLCSKWTNDRPIGQP